ncbi:glycosyltransferase [Rhizomonospora bruguierae]|uniref:glycosyltransferase n=1 Tax=Rhizomonospora bruguierae TaxID=1581705 RepID=UPI001BCAB794|nr:glycosyltransferase [Micromonospora sp. NBRC 107566]
MAVALVALAVVAGLAGLTTVNATRWLRRPPDDPPEVADRVAVLLPLRDEAHRVEPCLRALLGQRGVPNLTITALDDGSTDGTADLVREIAGDRVTLLAGEPPPEGWLGKPHACHRLAARTTAEYLVFVDADVVLAPHAVAAAVTQARRAGVDLLSPYPRIEARTRGERLVQPLLQWSWLAFLPLRAVERSPRPSLAAAGGQFLVVTRSGYDRAGGHAAVRDRVLEDIELARAVKRAGGRIALADGSRLASCRMYDSWSGLVDGYGKSLWAAFGTPAGAAAVVLLLLFLYPVQVVLAFGAAGAGAWRTAGTALCAYAVGVFSRVVAGRATGARTWPDALAHPLSIVVFAWLVVRSFRVRHAARWKGRRIQLPP